MKLEINTVKVEELTLGKRTYLDQRTLHIDPSDLEKRLLEDNGSSPLRSMSCTRPIGRAL